MMTLIFDYWPAIAGVFGFFGVGGIIVLVIGWPVVSAFFIGTQIGRWLMAAVGIAFGLLMFGLAMKRKGAAAERMRQKAANIMAAQKRMRSDEAIRKMSVADRRKLLDKWVR